MRLQKKAANLYLQVLIQVVDCDRYLFSSRLQKMRVEYLVVSFPDSHHGTLLWTEVWE